MCCNYEFPCLNISTELEFWSTYTLYGGCVTISIGYTKKGILLLTCTILIFFVTSPRFTSVLKYEIWGVPFSCGRLIRQIWDHFPRLVLDLHTWDSRTGGTLEMQYLSSPSPLRLKYVCYRDSEMQNLENPCLESVLDVCIFAMCSKLGMLFSDHESLLR